jgi:hypothetical protein
MTTPRLTETAEARSAAFSCVIQERILTENDASRLGYYQINHLSDNSQEIVRYGISIEDDTILRWTFYEQYNVTWISQMPSKLDSIVLSFASRVLP